MKSARMKSRWSDAIAAAVREERRRQEVSQEDLSARVGLSRNSISRLENGERIADISELAYIAEELGLTLTELVAMARERLDS